MSGKQRILVTQRVVVDPATGERRDALDQQWGAFLCQAGFLPVPVPNSLDSPRHFWKDMSPAGLLLTGGNDLSSYGGDAPERDRMELDLIDLAMSDNRPILGVCRGMQLLQHAAGTPLIRLKGHVARHQDILVDGKTLHKNSFHNWGTTSGTPGYETWAHTSDKVVKAVRTTDRSRTGIMWHPERLVPFQDDDIKLFQNIFGD